MLIEIEKNSGFCFGVVRVIRMAEEELNKNPFLYCLGDIVHNNLEVERLKKKGLVIITLKEFNKLKNCTVLLRAHGEPPEIYEIAKRNNIHLIDASCSVVLRLQKKIKDCYEEIKNNNGQIVIYGKDGHAEVNGLVGQTEGNAIVVGSIKDMNRIDFTKDIHLFSQTTQSKTGLLNILEEIKKIKIEISGENQQKLYVNDTICKQVSNRANNLRIFANKHELIIFVSSKKSSNGKVLYQICLEKNQNSKFISDPSEIHERWLKNIYSVGICGATSTPMWLMKQVENKIVELNKINK